MTKKLHEGQALTDTGQLIELVDVINCKVLLEREREREDMSVCTLVSLI
jgi:hypothetical protein